MNTILAIAETLVSAAVLFILYGVLVKMLGPARLGAWSVLTAATSAAAVADIGIGRAIARFVAVAEARSAGSSARYVTTGFITTCIVSAVVGLLAWWPVSQLLRLTLPADSLAEVAPLLPLTLIVFWLNGLASAAAAAVDGLHRSRFRSLAAVLANLIYLGASLLLISPLGMAGFALALLMREATRLLLLLVIVLNLIPASMLRNEAWDWTTCQEMLRYGLGLQSITVFVFLLEPASRLLLARFGSLDMVAFYDMAWRLVQQARSLIVAANQVLVPTFAEAGVSDSSRLLSVYRKASELTILASILLLGSILAAAPAISSVWLGVHQPVFETILRLVAVGWLVNCLVMTAYFLGTGSGKLRGLLASHAAQGGTNLILGWFLGAAFGGWGVVTATAISLAVGAAIVLLDIHLSIAGRRLPAGRPVILTASFLLFALTGLSILVELLDHGPLLNQLATAIVGCTALSVILIARHGRELKPNALLPRSARTAPQQSSLSPLGEADLAAGNS